MSQFPPPPDFKETKERNDKKEAAFRAAIEQAVSDYTGSACELEYCNRETPSAIGAPSSITIGVRFFKVY